MSNVKNKKMINQIALKSLKARKKRNLIAILAIALTSVLFTALFTIGGSLIEKNQESTMRQVGGSAHAGYKYLTKSFSFFVLITTKFYAFNLIVIK